MDLLTQNSKLKKTSKLNGLRVFNFGITAGLTCPQAGACAKFCYAKKGTYSWGNVKPAFQKRFEITKQDDFCELIFEEIVNKQADIIRIHDSGDFYNMEYLSKWLKIIEALPHVKFYAYTKSLDLFEHVTLPDNFTVIYSMGEKLDNKIDVEYHHHSKVFKSLDELKAFGYSNASDDDLIAIGEKNKMCLLYH